MMSLRRRSVRIGLSLNLCDDIMFLIVSSNDELFPLKSSGCAFVTKNKVKDDYYFN